MASIESQQKVFGFVLPQGADGELIKQTILAYLGAAFVITLFVAFVLPRFADLTTAQNNVKSLETKVNNLNKTLDALDGFKASVSETDKAKVFAAIPARFDPGAILLGLRSMAVANKVSLTTYALAGGNLSDKSIVSSGTTQNLISHLVKVEISGTPLNLIAFIESVDKSLPIGLVTNLSISEVSKILLNQTSDSKLAMDLTYYHLPLPQVSGSDSLSSNFIDLSDLDLIKTVAGYTTPDQFNVATTGGTIFGNSNLFGF